MLQLFLSYIQHENESLKSQINLLNKELEITKEKLHTVEQAWEQISKLGKYESYIATLKLSRYNLCESNILRHFEIDIR